MNQKITSFADVHRQLEARPEATKRFSHSLDHMYEVLDYLGNPQKRLRIIHVAGTSGKTSTAYYIAALLKEAGTKVGLTVSPHIDEVNERVQIDLKALPEDEFCSRFDEFLRLIKPCGVVLNYFETFITFAFWEFAQRKVDYAVVEVGIGGLLDSTNVVDDPEKVCVITDIGYDHTGILGSTLAEITAHKAGIIQLNNPVFCNQQGEKVMEVIRNQSQKKHADLHTFKSTGLDDQFDFLPLFQQRNFGLALQVSRFVGKRDGLRPIGRGSTLRAAYTAIPARMQELTLHGKIVIMDIAHNGQKLHGLLESVHAKYPGRRVAALLRLPVREGPMLRATAGLREVTKGVDHIILTSLSEEDESPDTSFNPEKLADICRQAGFDSFDVIPDPRAGFEALKRRPEPVLLVTGSTLLLNHVRPLLAGEL